MSNLGSIPMSCWLGRTVVQLGDFFHDGIVVDGRLPTHYPPVVDGSVACHADNFGRPFQNDRPEDQGLFLDHMRVVDRLVPHYNDQFATVFGHKAR